MSITIPAKAALTGTVTWSDSTPFDGYLLLGLVLPRNGDGQWVTVVMEGVFPTTSLPIWNVVPISAGQFDPNTFVWLNTSLTPENTQYVAYWYDLNNRRIYPSLLGGPPVTPFTITTAPYAISVPSLDPPSTASQYPVPQDSPSLGA